MVNQNQSRLQVTKSAVWVVCAGCMALLASTIEAQPGRPFRPGPRNVRPAQPQPGAKPNADRAPKAPGAEPFAEVKSYAFTLLHFQRMLNLQDDEVQRALKLTSVQIQAFRRDGQDAGRLLESMQSVPAAEREATIQNRFVPQAEKYQQLIDRELSEEQSFQLFRRIVQKQPGAIALLLPGVPERLELNAGQLETIYKIVDENRRTIGTIGNDALSNPLEMRKLMRRAMQSRQAAEAVLNAEQQAAWAALVRR